MSRASAVAMLALALAGVGPARAQSARDLVAQGVRAYRGLEYDAAAALLRRSLAADAAGNLSTPERAQALTYLGATELFRSQRDSAVAAFQDILQLDPRYQPDELIFPPDVTNLFHAVRRATKVIALVVPPVTDLRTRLDRFTARVVTTSLADVTVTLERDDGPPVRELYRGPVADSMLVTWDGLGATGSPPPDGRYVLRVASRAGTDTLPVRQVALDVAQQTPDTLLWPASLTTPPLLPERTAGTSGLRPLAAGLVAAAAAVALPSVVASGRDATPARFVVGATVGLAGLAGFITHERGRPLEANVRANARQREAWQRRLEAVQAENAKRRATVRLVVRVVSDAVADRGTR